MGEYNGKWTCKDRFEVTDIQYIDSNICYVKILNQKTGKEIEFGTPADDKQEYQNIENMLISETKIKALIARCEKEGVQVGKLLNLYKVKHLCHCLIFRRRAEICPYISGLLRRPLQPPVHRRRTQYGFALFATNFPSKRCNPESRRECPLRRRR